MKLVIAALVTVFTFSPTSKAGETKILPFENAEIYEIIKPELTQRSVWFEDLGENRIRVKIGDVNLVIEVGNEAIEKIIPKGRSQSPARNILTNVITQLKREKISFSLRCFDKTQWLVWEAQYTKRIEVILEEVASKMDPTNFGGFVTCA